MNKKQVNANIVFHLSNNPSLVIDKNYNPKQGQLGKGFYFLGRDFKNYSH